MQVCRKAIILQEQIDHRLYHITFFLRGYITLHYKLDICQLYKQRRKIEELVTICLMHGK